MQYLDAMSLEKSVLSHEMDTHVLNKDTGKNKYMLYDAGHVFFSTAEIFLQLLVINISLIFKLVQIPLEISLIKYHPNQ